MSTAAAQPMGLDDFTDVPADDTTSPNPTSPNATSPNAESTAPARGDSLCLSALRRGGRARVADLPESTPFCQRLMEMGLTKGTAVEVVRVAPLGDPMQIRVRGYELSLRRSDARLVRVETVA